MGTAMDAHPQPLASSEFLVVDTETNGRSGEECELTEVGAVLVGGGELHERFESLVRTRMPLSRGIERFTGITQAMIETAPPPVSTRSGSSLRGSPATRPRCCRSRRRPQRGRPRRSCASSSRRSRRLSACRCDSAYGTTSDGGYSPRRADL